MDAVQMIFVYILLGLAFGILGSMGIGGGIILIPVLTLFLKMEQHSAQAANLISFLPMAAFALYFHKKNKVLEYRTAFSLMLPGLIGGLAGAFFAKQTEPELLKRLFGAGLALLSLFRFFSGRKKHKKDENSIFLKHE